LDWNNNGQRTDMTNTNITILGSWTENAIGSRSVIGLDRKNVVGGELPCLIELALRIVIGSDKRVLVGGEPMHVIGFAYRYLKLDVKRMFLTRLEALDRKSE
jgi:hypothetical protein